MDRVFDYLKEIYNKHGYRLYMIGSTSRDYLFCNKIRDYDFVTDALPEESLKFIEASKAFMKYGVLKAKIFGESCDIVTLREECEYQDSRHPNKINFIKDINKDYSRRDFTINAIYINENYEIESVSSLGAQDLKDKRLRFIGDPLTRIKEDPLRILRAFRFIKEYNLIVDDETLKVLNDNVSLIEKLNPEKVKEENRKMKKVEELLYENK